MASELELATEGVALNDGSITSEAATSTKNVSIDTRTYRSYGVIVTDEKGATEFKAQGTKDATTGVHKVIAEPLYRQSTADGKAWASAEADGNTNARENQ